MGSGDVCTMNMSQLIHMGGYGFYVWPAYCITLFVFGFNLFLFVRERKQVKKILQRQLLQSK